MAAERRAPEAQMKRRSKSQPAKRSVFAAVGVLRQLTKIRTRVLCAIFLFPFGLWGQADAPAIESPAPQVKPAETAQIDIRVPGRLKRLIAPMPSAPCHAPDLCGYTSEQKSAELSPIRLSESLTEWLYVFSVVSNSEVGTSTGANRRPSPSLAGSSTAGSSLASKLMHELLSVYPSRV